MHAEIAADAVPGAVVVVEPFLPQRAARKAVELRPRRALREARQRECYMALQHAREAVAHLRRWLADRNRARHVGGAVEILGAGIEQDCGRRAIGGDARPLHARAEGPYSTR